MLLALSTKQASPLQKHHKTGQRGIGEVVDIPHPKINSTINIQDELSLFTYVSHYTHFNRGINKIVYFV